MLTTARIGFRVHRFEILVAVLACVIVTITAAIVTIGLVQASAVVPAGCFDAWFWSIDTPNSNCEGPVQAFLAVRDDGPPVMTAMFLLPLLVGLLLGVPLVAGELETRTAETAWILVGSRTRWLAYLAIPSFALILITVGGAAVMAQILAAAREPWLVDSPSWESVGSFGTIVVARGAVAFAVGLLAGAVVGRTLPALIVAVIACAFIIVVASGAREAWLTANQQPLDARNGELIGAIVLTGSSPMFIDSAGLVLTSDEANARIPPGLTDEKIGRWLSDNLREVDLGVPASAVPAWERLEVIALGGTAALLLVGSFVAVGRRRPRS